MNIKGIIAIQNVGPSGSLFLHSLLDGHPSLLSLPALYSRELYRFWEESKTSDVKELVERFVTSPYNLYWFNPDPGGYLAVVQQNIHLLGPNKNQSLKADIKLFKQVMIEFLKEKGEFSRRDYIESVYQAWHACFPKKMNEDVWIVFAFHSNPPQYAQYLAEDFKSVTFIYTLREPIQVINSALFFNYYHFFCNTSDYSYIFNTVKLSDLFSRELDFYSRLKKFEIDKNKYTIVYFGIKLEDIHHHPRKVLETLCHHLGIEFKSILLESTFEGLKWWNRGGGLNEEKSGFDKSIVKPKKLIFFNSFDIVRLHILLNESFTIMKYPFPKVRAPFYILEKLTFIIPFKMEFFPAIPFQTLQKKFSIKIDKKNLNLKPLNKLFFLQIKIYSLYRVPYNIFFGLKEFFKNYISYRKVLFFQYNDLFNPLDEKEKELVTPMSLDIDHV